MLIPLTQLRNNPYQRRVRTAGLDPEHTRALARSMRDNYPSRPDSSGLYQPLLVRLDPNDPKVFQVGDGHHRWAAAQLLHEGDGTDDFPGDERWSEIPVVVEEITDRDMLLMAVDTALNHKTLSPIDRASAFHALTLKPPDGAGLKVGQVAERYELSVSATSNLIRLLKLPKPVKALISDGTLTERHGRAMLPLVRVPGLLAEYAAEHGKNLWTTVYGHNSGGLLPGSRTLYLVTVAGLEENIRKAIDQHTRQLRAEPSWDPATPWSLDWTPPDAADVEEAVLKWLYPDDPRVPCPECPHAVTMRRGEAFKRCVLPACHLGRRLTWRAQQLLPQLAVIQEWCAQFGVPRGRIHTDEDIPCDWTEHGGYRAPAALVTEGLCGGEACECLRVVYRPGRDNTHYVQPDPERAPDFLLMCANTRRLAARNRKLDKQHPEAADAARSLHARRDRAVARAITRRRQQVLQTATFEPGDLGGNALLLQHVFSAIADGQVPDDMSEDPVDLWRSIVSALLNHIVNWRWQDAERLDAIAAVGAAVGVDVDDANDLREIGLLDAEELLECARNYTENESAVYSYAVERVRRLIEAGVDWLDTEGRAAVAENLLAWIEQGDDVDAALREQVEALIVQVAGGDISRENVAAAMDGTDGDGT